MAGVVRGIIECRREEVLVPEERRSDVGRIPGVVRERRVCVQLPQHAIERTVGRRIHHLPETKGAGPCGTHGRAASGRSYAIWWSVRYLVHPIAAYYAAYVPPLRFGAKPGPRGRRAA